MKRLLRVLFLILLIAVPWAGFIYYYHKEPLDRTFSPEYWWQRWEGTDLYDPRGILWHGNRSLPEIAITFDDGPSPKTTPKALDILKAEGIHATFFLVGIHIKAYPDLVRRILAEGHEIGCHSYDHQEMSNLDAHHVYQQIWDSRILLDPLKARFVGFRPPWTHWSDATLQGSAENHLPVIMDSVASDVFAGRSPERWASRLVGHVENGSIIIMHDTYPLTVDALPLALDALKARGYHFVKISEMLRHLPQTPTLPAVPGH